MVIGSCNTLAVRCQYLRFCSGATAPRLPPSRCPAQAARERIALPSHVQMALSALRAISALAQWLSRLNARVPRVRTALLGHHRKTQLPAQREHTALAGPRNRFVKHAIFHSPAPERNAIVLTKLAHSARQSVVVKSRVFSCVCRPL